MKIRLSQEAEHELRNFMDRTESSLEGLSTHLAESYWSRYVGKPSSDLNTWEKRISNLLLNRDLTAKVSQDYSGLHDNMLKRRILLIKRRVVQAAVESDKEVYTLRNRIDNVMIRFRPILGGRKVERSDINHILRVEANRKKRREAWMALSPLAARIEREQIGLMKLRQRKARSQGYGNVTDLALDYAGLKRREVEGYLHQIASATESSYCTMVEEGTVRHRINEFRPWDVVFLGEHAVVEPPDRLFPREKLLQRLKEWVKSTDLNLGKLPIQIKIQDIPYGGLCFGIHIPDDIRILVNPRDGYIHYSTIFHEFGHALHYCFTKQPTYLLKDSEPPCFAEGIGETFSHFIRNKEWLLENTDLEEADVDRFLEGRRIALIVRLRSIIANCLFEYEAYDDLKADLTKIWGANIERYLLAKPPLIKYWSSAAFYVTHPIYLQNYVIGEMIASQVYRYVNRRFHSPDEPEAMKFLIESFFAPASSIEWKEKLERSLGEKLGPEALLAELAG